MLMIFRVLFPMESKYVRSSLLAIHFDGLTCKMAPLWASCLASTKNPQYEVCSDLMPVSLDLLHTALFMRI